MLDFLKNKWPFLLSVGLFVGAFFVGRATAPVEIKEIEKRIVVEKEKEEVKITQVLDIEEVLRRVENTVKKNNLERKIVVIEKPDGTKTTTTTEKDKSTTETNKDTNKEVTKKEVETKEVIKEVVKYEEKIKIVEKKLRLDWSADVGVGYDIPGLWSDPRWNLIPSDNVVGIINIRRRIVGDLWVGVFGTSTGTAGATVGLQW